jgi:hypothetical protein
MRRVSNKPKPFYSLTQAAKDSKFEDKQTYKRVVEEIFKVAGQRLIYKNRVSLSGLGIFYLTAYKSDKKLVDFGMTKKLGKTIYHTNFHSNRVRYRISWGKSIRTKYYSFKPYRFLNRELAKKIINDD